MENPQPEPSMEEILASIRRIISEDEDDHPKPAAPAAPKPELTLKPAAPVQATAPVAPRPAPPAPPPPAQAPIQPQARTQDVEMPKTKTAVPMQDELEDDILDHTAAAAASHAFRTLSQSVRISEGPGRTLEDIVTEMLKPMVKEWLDANLPAIVEEKVEEEVQRVARRRRS